MGRTAERRPHDSVGGEIEPDDLNLPDAEDMEPAVEVSTDETFRDAKLKSFDFIVFAINDPITDKIALAALRDFFFPEFVNDDGEPECIFGPVVMDPPVGDRAMRLWDLTVGWLEFPYLFEMQRPKSATHGAVIADRKFWIDCWLLNPSAGNSSGISSTLSGDWLWKAFDK